MIKLKLIILSILLLTIANVNAIIDTFLTIDQTEISFGKTITFYAGHISSHTPVHITINLLDSSRNLIKNIKKTDINEQFYVERFTLTKEDYKKGGLYYINLITEMYNPDLGIETDTEEVQFEVSKIAPYLIQDIPNIVFEEDTTFSLDLNNYFSDDEGDILIYSVGSNYSQFNINVNIKNSLVTFIPKENFNGQEVMKAIAFDGKFYAESNEFKVIVNPVDDPAIWQSLENKAINEDSEDGTIVYSNLKTKCSDIDNEEIITIAQYTNYNLYFDNNDLKIRNLKENYNGQEIITLTCNNVPASFNLNINPVNDRPIINSYTPIIAKNMLIGEKQTFTVNAFDVDSSLIFEWYVNEIKQSETSNSFIYTASGNPGNRFIRVIVSDNELNALNPPSWTFYVAQIVNNPPYKPSNPNPADNAINVDINTYLSWQGGDPDGDIVMYDIYFGTNENPPLIKENNPTTNYQVELNYSTKYYWKIVAKDSYSRTSSDIWKFTTKAKEVIAINRLPDGEILYPKSDMTISKGDSISFKATGSDPDNDKIYYSWHIGGATQNDYCINQADLNLLQSLFGYSSKYRKEADIILDGIIDIKDVSSFIFYLGNSEICSPNSRYNAKYDLTTNVPQNSITSREQNPTVTFNEIGAYKVELYVYDSHGYADTTPATLTIIVQMPTENRSPIVSILQPAVNPTINVGDIIYFKGFAEDPDNDSIIKYEWNFGDGRTINVLVPGNVQYNNPGQYLVKFRAQDEHGLWSGYAMRTITVKAKEEKLIPRIILAREKIHIKTLQIINDELIPGDLMLINLVFSNEDNFDMNGRITISIPELAIRKRIKLNLEPKEQVSKVIPLGIPYAKPGEYFVTVEIYDGEVSRVKYRFINNI